MRPVVRALSALLSVSLAIPVAVGAPMRAAYAVTTHTFTGTDPNDPTAWTSAQNWDSQQVPTDGDVVVIDGKRVTNVPADRTFTSVTIRNGAHLDSGGPLATATFTAGCARSDVSINLTGSGSSSVYGLDLTDGAILTNSGVLAVRAASPPLSPECTTDTAGHRGRLRLHPDSQVLNLGVLRGDGAVVGMVCCLAPQELRNLAGGVIDGSDGTGLVVRNLRLRHAGRIRNGTVTVDGGVLRLTSSSRFESPGTPLTVEVVGDAVIHANETDPSKPDYTTPSTITLDAGSTLAIFDGDLIGRGTWTGTGTLALRGGSIQGQQRLSAATRLSVSGPDPKSIRRFTTTDPENVVVTEGPVTLGTGPVTLGGRLKLEPAAVLTVPGGSKPVVTGLTCCTSPYVLRNRGRIVVGPGGELRLRALQLSNAGTLGGTGRLVLDGGPSIFDAGGRVTGRVELVGGTSLTLSGTTTVDGSVDMLQAAVVGQLDSDAAVTGTGTWVVHGGSLAGSISFEDDLNFETAGSAMKSITTSPVPGRSTLITVGGPALLGGTGPIRLAGSASVRLAFWGTTTMLGSQIDATSCCTSPASVRFIGPVEVRRTSGIARIRNVGVSFWGRVDLNGGELAVSPAAITVADVPSATIALEGGRFRVDGAELVVPRSASVVGPGVVETRTLRLRGRARNATRGTLEVDGTLAMGADAQMSLAATSTGRDRVAVTGLAQLAGTLRLSGATLLPRGYRLLVADDRAERFSVLVGVPAGRRVVYGPTYVALG